MVHVSTPRIVGPSVRWSIALVHWSVGPFVHWSVGVSVGPYFGLQPWWGQWPMLSHIQSSRLEIPVSNSNLVLKLQEIDFSLQAQWQHGFDHWLHWGYPTALVASASLDILNSRQRVSLTILRFCDNYFLGVYEVLLLQPKCSGGPIHWIAKEILENGPVKSHSTEARRRASVKLAFVIQRIDT